MDDTSKLAKLDKWPRRLVPHNMYYHVHKIASAHARAEHLCFVCEDGDGHTCSGPLYPSFVNGQRPLASHILEKNGIGHLDEIKYVIAYHCGAFPNGLPRRLLKSEEDLSRIVVRATGTTSDVIGGIVGWLGLPK